MKLYNLYMLRSVFVVAVTVASKSVFSSFRMLEQSLARDIELLTHSTIPATADMYSFIHGNISLVNEKRETLPLSVRPATTDMFYVIHGNITLLDKKRKPVLIPYMYDVKIMQEQTLDKSDQNAAPSLIIGVLSSIQNQNRRISIRNTWGNNAKVKNRLFFLVSGEHFTPEMQQEMEEYHDLFYVQQPETYRWGLTPKTMAFFHAMTTGVIPFHYLLKTDDDSYVHVDRIQSWLFKTQPEYGGGCSVDSWVVRETTGPYSKFYVSHDLYPNRTIYPPYAQGAGYVLSPNASKCMSQSMDRVPFLPSEDANVGRLLHDFCDAPCTNDNRFHMEFYKHTADVAFLQHHVDENMIRRYHDFVSKPQLQWASEPIFHGNATLVDEKHNIMRIPYAFHKEKLAFLRPKDGNSSHVEPRMIVVVLSYPSNSAHRNAIRNIRRQYHLDASDTSLFFLIADLGSDLDLHEEFLQHRDMFVVLKQAETFANITLKVLTFFQAIHQHATHHPYSIVKIDEDSYANMPVIRSELQAHKGEYIGSCKHGQIERNERSERYVPESLLPASHTHFPAPYALGFGYIVSDKAVACLVQHSTTNPFLPVEDANTGWILNKYCDIPCSHLELFKIRSSGHIDRNFAVQGHVSLREYEQLAFQIPARVKRFGKYRLVTFSDHP